MISEWEVKKGDSTEIKNITVDNVDEYSLYTGVLEVLDQKTKKNVGFRTAVIPSIDEGFTVQLLPDATKELGVGNYQVVFEIIGTKADVVFYRRELDWPITITRSLINN